MKFYVVFCVTKVLDRPIRLLHVDDDIVVVDKPSSIPVHPIGTFKVSELYIIAEIFTFI